MDSLADILHKMADVPAGPEKYHKEGSVLQHTTNVIREIETLRSNDPDAFLIALFHDVGKIRTPENQLPNHYDHDELGAELIEKLPESTLSGDSRAKAKIAAEQHMRFKKLPEMKAVKAIRLIEDLLAAGITPNAMLDLIEADAKGREPKRSVDREKFEQCIERVYDAEEQVEDETVSNEQHRMQLMIEYYRES
jgi:tRNA nucleotidyltransferase (CCA-adding enzyme)